VDSFEAYPQAIMAYLNQGGNKATLDQALYDAEVANLPVPVATGDLTGDGVHEVVVALIDPAIELYPPPGVLLVYTCQEGQFDLSLVEQSGDFEGGPHIWYLEDLDGRAGSELVVSFPTCGAHTCFDEAQILSWTGAGFENRLQGTSGDLPYPDFRLIDLEGDGLFELEAEAAGFGSIGAGPQRGLRRVWAWDSVLEGFEVVEESSGPSSYRVHALHDAEAAARAGDYEAALLGYQRVINDALLEDWFDPENERAALSAYARFREVVVYAQQGQQEFAATVLSEMSLAYPAGDARHPFVEMAQAFLEAFGRDGAEAGCQAASAFAAANAAEVLDPLGPQSFGYANPEFEAGDMCP
jgi:hypothetical protein